MVAARDSVIEILGLEDFLCIEGEAPIRMHASDAKYKFSAMFKSREFGPMSFELSGLGPVRDRFECFLDSDNVTHTEFRFHRGMDNNEYCSQRELLNGLSGAWNTLITRGIDGPESHYENDFDPLTPELPAALTEPLRLPLLFLNGRGDDPALQVDVLHTARNSYLDIQSATSRNRVLDAASAAGVEVRFWEGEPSERWFNLE